MGKDVSGAASKDAPNIDAVANMGLVHVSFVFLSTHVSYILKMCIFIDFFSFFTIICVFLQKPAGEMEVATESLTCEPNKELSRSPPRDVPNIDIPDPADVVPAGVSYPLPLLTPICLFIW